MSGCWDVVVTGHVTVLLGWSPVAGTGNGPWLVHTPYTHSCQWFLGQYQTHSRNTIYESVHRLSPLTIIQTFTETSTKLNSEVIDLCTLISVILWFILLQKENYSLESSSEIVNGEVSYYCTTLCLILYYYLDKSKFLGIVFLWYLVWCSGWAGPATNITVLPVKVGRLVACCLHNTAPAGQWLLRWPIHVLNTFLPSVGWLPSNLHQRRWR